MGNCISHHSRKINNLPIHTTFKLPSPMPTWPPGERYANGVIDIGGLHICQISSFNKIWATYEGGPENLGATFFEPSNVPQGYLMLGSHCQSNNKPFHGWILVAKSETKNLSNNALDHPIDYNLVWSSKSLKIKQDGYGYLWLPIPPNGYKSVGYVVTNSPEKPSRDKIGCVRADLTDECEIGSWIWGPQKVIGNGFNVFSLIPSDKGTRSLSVCVGTFIPQIGGVGASNLPVSCLKNVNFESSVSFMPNFTQIEILVQTYSPIIYFHPDEIFLPSSVNWFFSIGALLYKNGDQSDPIEINLNGLNLPQGGSDDGAYWLDLPIDESAKEKVKKGDLHSSLAYVRVKPMFGGTYSDLALWVYYPFNGAARLKIGPITLPLVKIGEHIGDWEHLTLRVSNFTGELQSIYFSQHSKGTWVDAYDLEFHNANKPVAYASLSGHAFYPKPGIVLQGSEEIGIVNDCKKSEMVMDIGLRFSIVAAEYLGDEISEPKWLNYYRKWGPTIVYDIGKEIEKVEKILPKKLRLILEKFITSLPSEIFGEKGPVGPKAKSNWYGDEL